MNQPLFSITTPCWNSASTIERTIKSVLAQEFKDYEYIIVDGGSTDGTLDIIRKYEPLFEGRMKWKSEPDKGLYDAFNKGVERSTGVYCWNVNADDFIEPDALIKLSKLIESLQKDSYPVITGIANFVSSDGKTFLHKMQAYKNRLENSYNRDTIGIVHPATLVPKDVYNRIGLYDTRFKIIGDVDWFQRAYKAGAIFYFFDEPITNMADGGVSNASRLKQRLPDRKLLLRKKYNSAPIQYLHLLRWILRYYRKRIISKLR